MGLARRQVRRRSANHQHPESGQPNLARPLPRLRQRRLGARLLPEIAQPPPRISSGLVERPQLGRNQQALRSIQIRKIRKRARTSPPLNPRRGGRIPPPREQSERSARTVRETKGPCLARAFFIVASRSRRPTARTAPAAYRILSCIAPSRS